MRRKDWVAVRVSLLDRDCLVFSLLKPLLLVIAQLTLIFGAFTYRKLNYFGRP